MKLVRILTILLAAALLLSIAVPAFGADTKAEKGTLTRGELIMALYKLSGDWDVDPSQDSFTDVPAEGGDAQAIHWAVESGIVQGYGNRRFGPADPVTREQMAAMLYRNAQKLGRGFRGMWYFPLDYPDAGDISPWADEAMHWAVMNRIILGTDKGLEPRATATDAQLSLVLQRWQKALGDNADSVWYSFDDAALAMQVPADMEFTASSRQPGSFVGHSDRLRIDLSLWDRVSGPEPAELAALAAEVTGKPCTILEQGELSLVIAEGAGDGLRFFLTAPVGDAYRLDILPNTDAHPELTFADVAEEAAAVADSLRHSLNIPENETDVEMLQTEWPELDYLVLVNKLNALPEDWEAKLQLVRTVNSVDETVEVERTAYKRYLALKADLAEDDGIYTELDSAYRSIAAQRDIMDRFTLKYGADYAAKTVAAPGYSEHHTGLALDLYFRVKGEDGSFTEVYFNEDMEKEEYKPIWEKIHAKLAQYGFILRYLEGAEHITGYRYEPWHIRYVGDAETAWEIASRPGLTLEEYLAGKTAPEVTIDLSGSDIYAESELYDAMLAVKCRFAAFADCELHSIRYAGDDCCSEENLQWLNSLEGGGAFVQAAELLTDFHSPAAEGPYAWEPDTEYRDYQWWLGRTADGGWELVTMGY